MKVWRGQSSRTRDKEDLQPDDRGTPSHKYATFACFDQCPIWLPQSNSENVSSHRLRGTHGSKISGPGIAPEARSARREVHPPAAISIREHRRCQIAPLHINTIISPIPIRMFMPAIATPRQRSALMLSDWNLVCLPRTAFSPRDCPTPNETRQSFRLRYLKMI